MVWRFSAIARGGLFLGGKIAGALTAPPEELAAALAPITVLPGIYPALMRQGPQLAGVFPGF